MEGTKEIRERERKTKTVGKKEGNKREMGGETKTVRRKKGNKSERERER